MSASKPILFVSHKADRSGAPILLYDIIKAFKGSSDIPFQILLLQDGDLAKDFKALGKTYIWDTTKKQVPASLFAYLKFQFSRIGFIIHVLGILFHIRKTSLVLFNTITCGRVHKKLLFLNCRFICYVHELEVAVQALTNSSILQTALRNTNHFFAVSEAVKENLIIRHSVKRNDITVVPTPVSITCRDKAKYSAREVIIKDNNLQPNVVIIGIAGAAEWRKGFDLLAPLIKIYRMLFPDSNVHFIWKGFKTERSETFKQLYDIEKSGVTGCLSLLPHDSSGLEIMSAFDIHLLLSREDPFPLVVLEAASFGIPTVCFDNAGGASEFVEIDAGFCVPYADLLQLAKALHKLAASNALRTQMGLAAQKKLEERHNESGSMGYILEELQSLLSATSPELTSTVKPLLTT